MELVIVIAIILVCCLILDVNINYILFGVAIFVCIFFALLAIGFAYCTVRLAFSKLKEARFLRFDKVKNSKFQVAYYEVEGEEYPCIFPKEFIFEKILYSSDKICKVMLNTRTNKVYDRYAIITCVLGLILSTGFSVVMGMLCFMI